MGFPHVAQVARLDRIRELKGGRQEVETVWIVTSLTAEQAGPERLLELARQYWSTLALTRIDPPALMRMDPPSGRTSSLSKEGPVSGWWVYSRERKAEHFRRDPQLKRSILFPRLSP